MAKVKKIYENLQLATRSFGTTAVSAQDSSSQLSLG
ncbi:hypothetical protein CCP3SC5AM1_2130003 [Gammaproteobacteria bacterium]